MAGIDAMKILGGLLSSGALSRGSGSNVLGSLVGAVLGDGQPQASQATSGGLGELAGGLLGGGRSGPGLGDLLGGLLGGGASSAGAVPSQAGGLGGLIGMAMQQFGAAQQGQAAATRETFQAQLPAGMKMDDVEQKAQVLIRAMINSAKSDGTVDQSEQQKIVGQLGDVSPEEAAFVRSELAKPLDVQAFIASVPRGMEREVYTMSLMGIDLDSNQEARYLHELAQGLGIDAATSNAIHEQLGAPRLYR